MPKESEESKINTDLMLAVTSDKLNEINSDLTETLLDSFLNDGIIKDIPFIGIGLKVFQASKKVQDFFFLKKVLNFLQELQDIPQTKRIEFAEELESKGFQDAGEKMMFMLSRLDDINKATMNGRLLAAAIKKEISYPEYLKAAHIIDKTFIGDLITINPTSWKRTPGLSAHHLPSFIGREQAHDLFQAGLLYQKLKDNNGIGIRVKLSSDKEVEPKPPSIVYEINDICEIIMTYAF